MALAVLRFEEADGDVVSFHVDIGQNRYYQYQIGDDEARDGGGFAVLANPRHQSEIFGPLRPSALGRTSLEIPMSLFGRDLRFVQLTSYREPPDIGAAISEIVETPFAVLSPGLPRDEEPRRDKEYEPAPRRRLQRTYKEWGAQTMQRQMQRPPRTPINVQGDNGANGYGAAFAHTESRYAGAPYAAPFAYREARYSDAMFLPAIGSLLSSALPIVTKVISGLGGAGGIGNILGSLFGGGGGGIGNILGGLFGGGGAAPANPSGANPQSVTPDLARQIVELIQSLAAPQQTATASAGQKAAGKSLSRSLSGSGYSQQMVAPAVLAALPALAPLLEKALNPQTINAVMDHVGPKATMGAITDAVKDIGGLNIQAYQNILDHIQSNMPSSDTTPLLNHLLAVTASLSEPSILPSYRRVESVRMDFAPQKSVMLRGREQTVYRSDSPQGLAFPLTIDTPRPIRNATLYLCVKETETLRVVAEKQWETSNVATGPLSETPRLSRSEMGGLLPGTEYLVCAYLVWRTKQGELIGTSRTQSVHIAGEYLYQGVETGGEIVPLNDVEKFRLYWHKVWQDSFTREKRRWEWDCKYYYALHTDGGESERLETVTEETPGAGRRIEGRMKSGLRLSLSGLNALLPQISSRPMLNAAQMEALSAPSTTAAFGRAARSKAQFRGSEGDSVALWVYPEMRIQPIVLLRMGAPDGNGLVTEFTEETAHFPIPALAHFVGVSTEPNPYPALGGIDEEI
jgi:hypothetical protein